MMAMNRFVFWLLIFVVAVSCVSNTEGYKNYTVGGKEGWKSGAVDYAKWSAAFTFNLGDFLIFNTDTNHTVIQTYNETVYKNCENDADDEIEYTGGQPSALAKPVTVAVPLVKTGSNYFFSGNYDGLQCKNGLKFEITVEKGQGLPPSLKRPPPPAPTPESSDDDDSLPPQDVPGSITNPIVATPASPDVDAEADDTDTSNGNLASTNQAFISCLFAIALAFAAFC